MGLTSNITGWITAEKTEVSRMNVKSKTLGQYLNSQHLVPLSKIQLLKERYLP